MANCLLENIELDAIVNGIVDINATYATNSYGNFIRRSDGARIPLMSFKSISNSGNNFILENDTGFREIRHVKLSVPDEVTTGLFEVDMPNNARLFIDFFVTCSFIESSTIGSAAAIKGVVTAVCLGNGTIGISSNDTFTNSLVQVNTTQTLNVSLTADQNNHKVILNVTQNSETIDVAQTVMVYAKIGFTISGTSQKPKVTLL
jgi:hypothetical protein